MNFNRIKYEDHQTDGARRTMKKEWKWKKTLQRISRLIYLANATREPPDIAFTAGVLSRFCLDSEKAHWNLAKKILRYLKNTSNYRTEYSKNNEKLKAYTDSDWAGDIDRKSCTRNILILAGGPIN